MTKEELAAREEEWLHSSSEMTTAIDELVRGRDDVIVRAGDDVTIKSEDRKKPRAFFAQGGEYAGEIRIDTKTLPEADPENWQDEEVLRGLLTHETAHASHTLWTMPPEVPYAAGLAAKLLEESRVEKRQLTRRPQDRKWLRASAETLIAEADVALAQQGGHFTSEQAVRAAALILPRANSGVLLKRDVRKIRKAVSSALGYHTMSELERISKRALKVRDNDADGMIAVGKEWVDILVSEGFHEAAYISESDFANDGEEEGKSEEGYGRNPFGLSYMPPLNPLTMKPLDQKRMDAAEARMASKMMGMTMSEADMIKQIQLAKSVGDIVFSPPGPGSDIVTFRYPNNDERTLARRTKKRLQEAYLYDKTRTRIAAQVPPGRLSGKVLQQADALRSAGVVVTPEPFVRKEIKRDINPPLRVAILQDVSGSQSAFAHSASIGAWALATAARGIPESQVAMVGFGETVYKIFGPFEDIPGVPSIFCGDNGEVLSAGLAAVEGKLDLLSRRYARLVVIITDGHFVTHGELGKRDKVLRRLIDAGVRVLWINTDGESGRFPGRSLGATVAHWDGSSPIEEMVCEAAVEMVSHDEE